MKLLKYFECINKDVLNQENEIDNQKINNFLNKSNAVLISKDMETKSTKTFTKNDATVTQYMKNEGLFEKSCFTKNNYSSITYEGFIKNTKSFKQKTYVNITIDEMTYSRAIKIKQVDALIKPKNKDFEHIKHFSHIMKAEDNDNKIYEMINEIEEYLTNQNQLQKHNFNFFKFNYSANSQRMNSIENVLNN